MPVFGPFLYYLCMLCFQLSILSEVRPPNFFGLSLLRGLGHRVVAGFVIEEIGKIGQVFASCRCSVPSFTIFACSAFQLSILSEVRLLNFFGLSFLRGLGHRVVAEFVIEEIGKVLAGVRIMPVLPFFGYL